MIKRYRDLLRVVVADLRHTLSGGTNGQRGDLDRELERLGIAPDGTVTPFDALPNPTPIERRARRVAEALLSQRINESTNQRGDGDSRARSFADSPRSLIRAEIVERAAYTWINRLLALRAMEARGLINEILRSDPAYDGLSEALFVLRQTQPARAAGHDGGWWAVIEDACGAQAASLPGLFDLADPSAALRPSTPALLRCVALIGTTPAGYTAEEADATFADPDAIGWAYQFYQEEAKARTYAKLNSGGKAATRAEIASVTQLFTEPYMVKWLLQNSLGRTYHELYPDSRLPETWEYFIHDLPRDAADPDTNRQSAIANLQSLTFMDPCMGSGHFEREAFDMVFAMYREQYPDMSAAEIADRILTHHLHGIDLDPRAAQLAALTLYLRAWELVRDERRAQRLPGPGAYRPPAMNLATTPTGLTPGSLERHLQRHPADRIYRPLLEGIFAALEQADMLGSLLRPGEQLDAAIRAFRAQGSGQLGLLAEDNDLNRLLGELARHDPGELKRVLLERVAHSIAEEAGDADDVTMSLFGREASEGVRLLQLLDRQYTAVATNPPYMGSAHMCADLRNYVEHHYSLGKRDLYAAFLLRMLLICSPMGRVALVSPDTWTNRAQFADLRYELLKQHQLEALVQLDRHAFSEADPPGRQTLVSFCKRLSSSVSKLETLSCTGVGRAEQQAGHIRKACQGLSGLAVPMRQSLYLQLPSSVIVAGASAKLATLLEKKVSAASMNGGRGLSLGNNPRFLRFSWECPPSAMGYRVFVKSMNYSNMGLPIVFRTRWRSLGADVRKMPGARLQNMHLVDWEQHLLTIVGSKQGVLAAFDLTGHVITHDSCFFVPYLDGRLVDSLGQFICTRLASVLFRLLYKGQFSVTTLDFVPETVLHSQGSLTPWRTRKAYVAVLPRGPLTTHELDSCKSDTSQLVWLRISVLDGMAERIAIDSLDLRADLAEIYNEVPQPLAWHPLLENYDTLPLLPPNVDLPSLPQEVLDHLTTHKRVHLEADELARVKSSLRRLYEAGPGAKAEDPDVEELERQYEEDETVAGAHIPIVAETFLEELSQKLQIHPISVYWLLDELRSEGVRCKPEELRLLEDRLSVLVLRLLGHRWPRQIEAGEPVPSWADPDGIIPLTTISGETGLAERVRSRLRVEDGDRGAQQTEALLRELTGQTLEEWLRRSFFARHVRQFKHRPIAWHLASTPTRDGGRRTKARREPAFECLLYYHACRGDVLARLRAHYVEPLIRLETAAAADARRRGDETVAAIAVSRVQELEDFATRLRDVEESGFARADVDRLLADEPLDRWSGDGIVPPASADELAAQERAWRVDINDGVRVNVAPLQLAGLLTGDVLRPDDARKAIADRARWRSDERRWVREGVLPRCGWMGEDVPESPRWTERAPEREAEQRKLEEKRRAVMGRLDG